MQRADFEASKQPARPGLEMMRQAYAEQLQALVIGLPWRRLGEAGVITVL